MNSSPVRGAARERFAPISAHRCVIDVRLPRDRVVLQVWIRLHDNDHDLGGRSLLEG